jgi:SSS family solute:Na+ symporter
VRGSAGAALLVPLALFALLLVGAGLVLGRRVRGASDFFVAGRALPGWLVFTTLLAANIGAGSTVGATGLAYRHGLGAWWWSGSAALGCILLGAVVAPRLHRLASAHGFITVGDFLEWRFDRGVRALVTGTLWLGTLAILAGQLIAMAWAFEVLLGLPKAWGCLLAAVVIVGYVSGAGLLASAWVNLLELVVLLVGFLIAAPLAWRMAGGWPALRMAGGTDAYGSLGGMGLAGTFGLLVLFVPSFAVSPGLVQKTYGARSARAASAASLLNAAALLVFALLPPVFGMAARVLRPGLANPELALPTLMTLLPPWLGGLTLAALFAAEISTADAVLFMLATSLSQDLYRTFLRPEASDRELLRMGRLASLGAGTVGVLLAIALPSVVDALKTFYGVMTLVLFVPLMAGVLVPSAGVRAARGAIAGGVLGWGAGLLALRGGPYASFGPHAVGLAVSAAAVAALRRR